MKQYRINCWYASLRRQIPINFLRPGMLYAGLVASCQLHRLVLTFNKLQLTCQFHGVATIYNLLKHLAASLWITSFDNQLATSLLTTCNRLVVNKLSQAMRTHPDIGLLITSLLQVVHRLVANCMFLAQRARESPTF